MPFRRPNSQEAEASIAAGTPPQVADAAGLALASVRSIAAPICAAHAIDLVDVGWSTDHGNRILRVTIERRSQQSPSEAGEQGWGVSLENCADLSRDLSAALDQDDVVPGSYNLEVSSPGLERELFTTEDLVRFTGKLARIKLARPAPDGQKLLRGKLVAVEGEAGSAKLTMLVDDKDITVAVADIAHANLVFEMTKAPKTEPGSRTGPGRRGPVARPKSGSGAQGRGKRQAGVKGSGS